MKLPALVLLALFAAAPTLDVHGQTPTLQQQQEALKTISDFANSLCDPIKPEGKMVSGEISGAAKAKLNGVLSKVADLGVEGAGKYQTEEYQGLLRKDLSKAMENQSNCKQMVFKELKDRLLPVGQPAGTAKTSTLGSCIGQGGMAGISFWGPAGHVCMGVAAGSWGKYLVDPALTVKAVCGCKGHGGFEGVQAWGPAGQRCYGISEWGQFAEQCVSNVNVTMCSCPGKGAVLTGYTLWGPKEKYCGGFSTWGYYDDNCVEVTLSALKSSVEFS